MRRVFFAFLLGLGVIAGYSHGLHQLAAGGGHPACQRAAP
jgi:FKBP-type peptidyl-prolyl cis-trans isomerase